MESAEEMYIRNALDIDLNKKDVRMFRAYGIKLYIIPPRGLRLYEESNEF